MEFNNGVRYRLWPLMSRVAGRHRSKTVRDSRIVSVVGSYGKTTTARAVIAALGCRKHQRMGMNCWNHVAEALLRVQPADGFAVLEIGIDGVGQMVQYARIIRPDITVVTSIGSEHHRSLGDVSGTRREKAEMVRILDRNGTAVLNGDDPNVLWMRDHTQSRVLTFGFGEANDVVATDIVAQNDRTTTFRVNVAGESHRMRVQLVGVHTIYSVLAALAVIKAEGRSVAKAAVDLEKMNPTPGRMQPVVLSNGVTLLRDDYKSGLETVHAALDTFSRMTARRKIVVLGDVSEPPGSQGPIYREIGGRVAGIADRAIILGGNYQRYAAGAVPGGMPRDALEHAGSVLEATDRLREIVREGDLVLIKGRDTQRLERITCALEGRTVHCDISFCPTRITSCEECPMLERGWRGRRVVI